MKERKIITKSTYYKIHEMKVHIKKKRKVHIMNFADKEQADIMDFWETKGIFFKAESW